MAGKAPVRCNHAVYLALDTLTKNQLIDLVVELSQNQPICPATDRELLLWVQDKMRSVWQARKDKPLALAETYQRWIESLKRTLELEPESPHTAKRHENMRAQLASLK